MPAINSSVIDVCETTEKFLALAIWWWLWWDVKERQEETTKKARGEENKLTPPVISDKSHKCYLFSADFAVRGRRRLVVIFSSYFQKKYWKKIPTEFIQNRRALFFLFVSHASSLNLRSMERKRRREKKLWIIAFAFGLSSSTPHGIDFVILFEKFSYFFHLLSRLIVRDWYFVRIVLVNAR